MLPYGISRTVGPSDSADGSAVARVRMMGQGTKIHMDCQELECNVLVQDRHRIDLGRSFGAFLFSQLLAAKILHCFGVFLEVCLNQEEL